MRRTTPLAISAALLLGAPLAAQRPAAPPPLTTVAALDLERRPGLVSTLHRPAHAARAAELQAFIEEAVRFFDDSLRLRGPVTLAVLGREDWERTARQPYGIPYYEPRDTMIVLPATLEGAVVESHLATEAEHGAASRALIRASGLSYAEGARKSVDLIGFHELGHHLTRVAGIRAPSRWVSEYVASYFAYAYMRRRQPALADLWDGIVPQTPAAPPRHTSLADFDRLYFGVGPENYFWYQGAFASHITTVFADRGTGFLAALREAFPADDAAPRPDAGEALARLERIRPGFTAWAAALAASPAVPPFAPAPAGADRTPSPSTSR